MPQIAYDEFGGGLDRRHAQPIGPANALWVLKNAYVTTGKKIRKRPCFPLVATLEAGTKGLRAAGGKLNTFYGQGSITHANSLFLANKVAHPSLAVDVAKAHFGENFNGFLYAAVEYTNGDVRHHYLDEAGIASWDAGILVAKGDFRKPTAPNGFRYQVTDVSLGLSTAWIALTSYGGIQNVRPTVPNGFRYTVATAGTSGAIEPTWPTTNGATVTDGTVVWTCRDSNTTGPTEPAWPTTAGATVDDSFVRWTCHGTHILDANCPNSKLVRKLAQKIYASSTSDVKFCATSRPRDWSSVLDAGSIPSGINAAGADVVTALGDFGGDLGTFFSDSIQVWDVDANPANNRLKSTADSIGTIHGKTPQSMAGDLLFLSKAGFRSLSVLQLTDNMQENDVGSAIDALRSEIADADDPISIYYPGLGQFMCINGTKAYVYSFSRSVKLSAWSVYELPFNVDDADVLSNDLYVRSGDNVYKADPAVFNDNGSNPLVEVEMYFQDGKAPGIEKQFSGFDAVVKGEPEVAFRYDPRNPSLVTPYYALSSDTRPGELLGMEICATSVAPIWRHQANEEFEIDQMLIHYEKLGPV